MKKINCVNGDALKNAHYNPHVVKVSSFDSYAFPLSSPHERRMPHISILENSIKMQPTKNRQTVSQLVANGWYKQKTSSEILVPFPPEKRFQAIQIVQESDTERRREKNHPTFTTTRTTVKPFGNLTPSGKDQTSRFSQAPFRYSLPCYPKRCCCVRVCRSEAHRWELDFMSKEFSLPTLPTAL